MALQLQGDEERVLLRRQELTADAMKLHSMPDSGPARGKIERSAEALSAAQNGRRIHFPPYQHLNILKNLPPREPNCRLEWMVAGLMPTSSGCGLG
jgi:hypothetical protein